jgi:peptidyl-prolyl cis-trans isomerase SurA
MLVSIARPLCASAAAAFLAVAISIAVGCSPAQAQQTPKAQKAASHSAATQKEATAKAAQAIVVLVNDEPVTAYEIEQRAALIAATTGGGGGTDLKARAEVRWAQIVKEPRTNEHLQQLLREKNVKSEAEARAVQAEYAKTLQHDMIEQLKREARAAHLPQLRKEAEEELIEERLKIQEAKKLGLDIGDEDIKRVMKGLAEQNKMTEPQFIDHLKGMGIDATTMRERYRGQFAWRDVIRRKFANQVTINDRDIDRMITSTASASGEDTVELQVQKITLAMPVGYDQAALARRYSEAEALQRKYAGCKSMAGLVKDATEARFEEGKFVKPSSIAEPTRSMLLSAKDGDILPPATVAAGVELYAVCSRRAANADAKQREKAQGELQQREFEILAKRYMRNLRQDAHIEYR